MMNGKTQGGDPELSALAQEGGAVAQSQKREGTTVQRETTQRENRYGKMMQNEKCHFYIFNTFKK